MSGRCIGFCKVENCGKRVYARKLCACHNWRIRKYGSLDLLGPTTEDKFWAQVDRSDTNGCWIWNGSTTNAGYGRFHHDNRRSMGAHVFSYMLANGPVPDGKVIDHLCRTPLCVNPGHMEPVTERENILRGTSPSAINARATHCKRGHAFSGDNLILRSDGKHTSRVCRTCMNDKSRRDGAARRIKLRTLANELEANHA